MNMASHAVPHAPCCAVQVLFSQLLLTMLCAMEWGVYVMSAFFCVVMLVFSLWCYPETRGLSLEQVQE